MKSNSQKRICPNCKQEFLCVNSIDCWCNGIEIHEYVKIYLELHYETCICEKCIIEMNKEVDLQ